MARHGGSYLLDPVTDKRTLITDKSDKRPAKEKVPKPEQLPPQTTEDMNHEV